MENEELMTNNDSPYSAAFTAASMVYYETNQAVPILLQDCSRDTIKSLEDGDNQIMIKSLKSRQRIVTEIVRRFKAVPSSFWEHYLTMTEKEQRVALYFVCLKAYKLLFDFQINLVMPKYSSANADISSGDFLSELYNISARDEFVDSWSDDTKKKVANVAMLLLQQAGLYDTISKELVRPDICDEALAYYIKIGEAWFLQACSFQPYEIENLKALL